MSKKIFEQDPLEGIKLGTRMTKIPIYIYINTNLDPSLRLEVIKLLKEYKDYFAWDDDKMFGLSRDLVMFELPIKHGEKSVKQMPRRFAP